MYLCLSVCILCFCFSCCIYVVLLSAQWGGSNGIEAQSLRPLFLQCFDTVGWVFLPIKPVPDMTYNVFGGTLNLAQFNSVQFISDAAPRGTTMQRNRTCSACGVNASTCMWRRTSPRCACSTRRNAAQRIPRCAWNLMDLLDVLLPL